MVLFGYTGKVPLSSPSRGPMQILTVNELAN